MTPKQYKKCYDAERRLKDRFKDIPNAMAWVTADQLNNGWKEHLSVDLTGGAFAELATKPLADLLERIRPEEEYTIGTDRTVVNGPCRMDIVNPARAGEASYLQISGDEPDTGLRWSVKLPLPSAYVNDSSRKLESYAQDIYYPRSGQKQMVVKTKVWKARHINFVGGNCTLIDEATLHELWDRMRLGK